MLSTLVRGIAVLHAAPRQTPMAKAEPTAADTSAALLEHAGRHRLDALAALGLGVDVAARITRARARAHWFAAAAAEVHTRLDQHCIAHAFLKGVASDQRLFLGSGARGTSDIDLVVDDLIGAQHAIADITVAVASEQRRPRLYGARTTRSVPVALFGGRTVVDMSSALLPNPPFFDDTAHVLRRARPTTSGLPILADADAMAYAAGNLVRDRFSGLLKLAVDLAAFTMTTTLDWHVVVRRARSWRVSAALHGVLALLDVHTACEVPAYVLRALAPSRPRAAFVNSCVHGVAIPSMLTRTLAVDSLTAGMAHLARYAVPRAADAAHEAARAWLQRPAT